MTITVKRYDKKNYNKSDDNTNIIIKIMINTKKYTIIKKLNK